MVWRKHPIVNATGVLACHTFRSSAHYVKFKNEVSALMLTQKDDGAAQAQSKKDDAP